MAVNYVKPEKINLRNHSTLDEHWVQNLVADDPSILGLGDLVLRERERTQPRAGRLDLLLQDPDSLRRYEVEIQLGSTDESHIIRTIEYWDIEKKRYPQYEHCAVLIAEDITSRFLNVIPLIAIQMQVLSVGDKTTVVFTTVWMNWPGDSSMKMRMPWRLPQIVPIGKPCHEGKGFRYCSPMV